MNITHKETSEVAALGTDDLGLLLEDTDHISLMEVLIDKLETIGQERKDEYGEKRWEAAQTMKEMLADFD